MADEDETRLVRRPYGERTITVDRVLQTVGGILLTVCLVVTGWVVTEVVALKGQMIRQETKSEASDRDTADIKRDLKEIKDYLMNPSRRGAP